MKNFICCFSFNFFFSNYKYLCLNFFFLMKKLEEIHLYFKAFLPHFS